MNLQFVEATCEDIPVIFAQAKNLIDTYEDCTEIDYEKVIRWLRNKIAKHITQYYCVRYEQKPCAYYRLCADGELDDIYVLPDYRCMGIGTEILKKCIKDTEKTLYLYVFTGNCRAISFYERFGFTCRETVGKTRMILERKG